MAQSRRIAVIMFTDIVGYTALMGRDERLALSLLHQNKELHLKLLHQFNGQLLKELGDGMLCSFKTITDAVYCAGVLLKEVEAIDELQLRIGINVGEVVVEGKELYGDGVNIASRIEGIAGTGQLLVSEAVYQNIRNKSDFKTTFIGEHTLKNVSEPIKVYAVEVERIPKSYASIDDSSSQPISKYLKWGTLGILLMGMLFLVMFLIKPSEISNTVNSIAVLPFTNMSNDPDQEYFCDGMTDQILTNLASVKGLQVMGRTSVVQFKNTEVPISEIAEKLNVNHVLEASIQKMGDRIIIIAQLLNAEGFHIWADKFDKTIPKDSLFDLQDQLSALIATSISENLDFKLEHDTRPRNSEAYEYFIQAKHIAIHEYYWKYDSLAFERAYLLYNKAIDSDPYFALAYSGLADLIDARIHAGERAYSTPAPVEYDSLRTAYTNKGYQLDPNAAFTNYMKGVLASKQGGSIDSIAYFAKHAVVLSPKDPYYYLNFSMVLANRGLFEHALEVVKKALSLDPLDANLWATLGTWQIKLLNFEEGFKSFQKARDINNNPYNFMNYYRYVRGFLIKGENEKAIEFLKSRQKAGFPLRKWDIELMQIANGEYDKVESGNVVINGLISDKEGFFTAWEAQYHNSPDFCDYLTFVKNPTFETFKNDPRYPKMLARSKVRYDEFVARFGDLPF